MAEFCNHCCDFMDFEKDAWGLGGLCKEGEEVTVICECCGVTAVDHEGNCLEDHIIGPSGYPTHPTIPISDG